MGDLCSLSEHDVHQLPIRVPKIASLRKVMAKYQDKLRKQKLVESDMGQCRFQTLLTYYCTHGLFGMSRVQCSQVQVSQRAVVFGVLFTAEVLCCWRGAKVL